MEAPLAITQLLNRAFSAPLCELLKFPGVPPAVSIASIDNKVALQILVVLGFIILFAIIRLSLSVENPGTLQQLAEIVHELISGLAKSIIGSEYERFQAFVTCIFLFVLTCNLLGLIPGLSAPTGFAAVPFGLALATFIYYNYHGIRAQGPVGYLKHFAGPIWWISWLLFPIEVISHLARVMSLTIRLWANMYAGDLVTWVFFSLVPAGIPVIFLGLHLGVSIVQAFVFTLLAMIYLSQATAHEH